MSDTGSPDVPGTAVHPVQPAEGDREEVDQALAAQAADEGQEPADDAGPGDN
jgi:hypothetical protein